MRTAILLGLVGLVAGCSILLNEDAKQCSTDSDCTSRAGVGFQYSYCDPVQNVCVPSLQNPGDGGKEEGSSSCKHNADCLTLGQDVCVGGRCVGLQSAACPRVYGGENLQYDDAYGIGMISYGSGNALADQLGSALQDAADLAFDRFAIAGPSLHPQPHPFIVHCDESNYQAAFNHLANDVGVVAVVGPQLSEDALSLADALPNTNVPLFLPVADSPQLQTASALADSGDGLLWAVRPNRLTELPFLTPILQKARELLATGSPTQFATLQVGYVVGSDQASKSIQGQLSNYLPPGSQIFTYSNPSDLAQQITTSKTLPNLVVASSNADPWDAIVQAIEAAWPATTPPPWYVLRDYSDSVLFDVASGKAPRRILGITFAKSTNAQAGYKRFKDAFFQSYRHDPIPEAEYGYDAMSLALLASYAWKTTGSSGSTATWPNKVMKSDLLPILTPPGPAQVLDAFDVTASLVLAGSSSGADAYGASGDLNLNSDTLSPAEDGLLYCLPKTGSSYCDTGFTFSHTDGTPSGSLNSACDCF